MEEKRERERERERKKEKVEIPDAYFHVFMIYRNASDSIDTRGSSLGLLRAGGVPGGVPGGGPGGVPDRTAHAMGGDLGVD